MIEFYQAYATYHDVMDLTENLFRGIAVDVCGNAVVQYQGDAFVVIITPSQGRNFSWVFGNKGWLNQFFFNSGFKNFNLDFTVFPS
jgi:hypothetical protein